MKRGRSWLMLMVMTFGPSVHAQPAGQSDEMPLPQVEIRIIAPRPASSGDAGIDRFEPDMSKIRSHRRTDGVLIIELNDEGKEHLQLLQGRDGRPRMQCTAAMPGRDFRRLPTTAESDHATR